MRPKRLIPVCTIADLVFGRDIRAHEYSFAASILDSPDGRLATLRVDFGNHNPRTFLCILQRNCFAYASATPGYDRHPRLRSPPYLQAHTLSSFLPDY